MEALRHRNAQIASAYNAVPYDDDGAGTIDLAAAFAVAASHGVTPALTDVLDVGCGTGAQLARAGVAVTGRVVGIDISAGNCVMTRARCVAFGARATIHHADVLDMDPATLDQFDVVLSVGMVYVVPVEVRRAILRLIGRCLKSNGVAVVSYMTGTNMNVQAGLYRLLRASTAPAATPAERVDLARQHLRQIVDQSTEALRAHPVFPLLGHVLGMSDALLLHQVLNPDFEVIDTPTLEREMGAEGLRFLNYVPALPLVDTASDGRAISAAIGDLFSGGYRYAVFARQP
jgi:SAM-dependent methyltransferase